MVQLAGAKRQGEDKVRHILDVESTLGMRSHFRLSCLKLGQKSSALNAVVIFPIARDDFDLLDSYFKAFSTRLQLHFMSLTHLTPASRSKRN